MSGSKKWFVYQTDDGENFAVLRDESNTEAVNGATGDFTSTSAVIYSIPKNVKPRYVVYRSADKTITRKCVALTQSLLLAAPVTIVDGPTGLTLTRKNRKAETIKLPYPEDTGLDDGDAT